MTNAATSVEDFPTAASPEPLRILLVEDSPDYAVLVRSTLSQAGDDRFLVDHAGRLDRALDMLEIHRYDAVLLDLSLPDAFGAFTIRCACARASDIPILVLTGTQDTDLSMTAVRAGAQAYLVKGEFDRKTLPGILERTIARHRDLRELCSPKGPEIEFPKLAGHSCLMDEETGLPNKAAYWNTLSHTLERVQQSPRPIALLLLEFDHWKVLEERLNEEERTNLLRNTAVCLSGQTRTGHSLSHLGDARFALIIDCVQSASDITASAQALLLTLSQTPRPPDHTPDPSDAQAHPDTRWSHGPELTASIGIAVFPLDGDYAETLHKSAEEGLRAAVSAGGNRSCFCLLED